MPAIGIAAPDDSFRNDGKLTKRDARASALAKLAPFPQAVLWDIGSGSGAVSIDFLRAAPGATAHAIDRNDDQHVMAIENATIMVSPDSIPSPLILPVTRRRYALRCLTLMRCLLAAGCHLQ